MHDLCEYLWLKELRDTVPGLGLVVFGYEVRGSRLDVVTGI